MSGDGVMCHAGWAKWHWDSVFSCQCHSFLAPYKSWYYYYIYQKDQRAKQGTLEQSNTLSYIGKHSVEKNNFPVFLAWKDHVARDICVQVGREAISELTHTHTHTHTHTLATVEAHPHSRPPLKTKE